MAETPSKLILESTAFVDQGLIPRTYTCNGANISPPLHWTGRPQGTKSFVLIVDDPDAPDPEAPIQTFVHWVIYDIPSNITDLAKGVSQLPNGAKFGFNDHNHLKWDGPCPPRGEHRYFYKLYALDKILNLRNPPKKSELEEAMKGHVLDKAQLIGLYGE